MAKALAPHKSSGVPKLPYIEHPLSRKLDLQTGDYVRGVSRNGNGGQQTVSGRPLTQEHGRDYSMGPRRRLWTSQSSSGPLLSQSRDSGSNRAINGGPNENKNELRTPGNLSDRPANSRLSQVANTRLETDEMEICLREKVKGSFYEIRKRFTDHDTERKGSVSREALQHILVSLLGCPISASQLGQLLTRLGLPSDARTVAFSEFVAGLCLSAPRMEEPRWIDPIQRKQQARLKMSAEEVQASLVEKIRSGIITVQQLTAAPQNGEPVRVLKPDLHNALLRLLFFMDDAEFERLWMRLDKYRKGFVTAHQLLKELGFSAQEIAKMRMTMGSGTPFRANSVASSRISSLNGKMKVDEDKVGLWIKTKFREGFAKLAEEFKANDPDNTDYVDHDKFLEILSHFGISLNKRFLAAFLDRCNVKHRHEGVPYKDFLFRFQDRSETGAVNQVMSEGLERIEEERNTETVSVRNTEAQLVFLLQKDFLDLLKDMHKHDPKRTGLISRSDFRACIDARFNLNLSDEMFDSFMRVVPCEGSDKVKYSSFLSRFDGRGLAPSLFGDENSSKNESSEDGKSTRSVQEVQTVLRHLLQTRLPEVIRIFEDMDEFNTNRISQKELHQLMSRFEPKLTRADINSLWDHFILNGHQSLDLWELLRCFLYHPLTSAFPNAKVEPPKLGDADLIRSSNHLSGINSIILQSLKSRINYKLANLRDEFFRLDPKQTGFLSYNQFQKVLSDLQPGLSSHELTTLSRKFDLKGDGTVCYLACLKPFAMKRLGWRQGDSVPILLPHDLANKQTSTSHTENSTTTFKVPARLARQLSGCSARSFRVAFRHYDTDKSGQISITELRQAIESVLRSGVDDDDLFEVMCHCDSSMIGRVRYELFLKAAFPSKGGGALQRK